MVMKEETLHMNAGDGDTSYAKNSEYQKYGILKAWHVLDETLKEMAIDGFQKCFKMADLGCSSGPNSLLAVSHIVDTIEELYKEKNYTVLPEFEVFLNDLPENDFNNLFKMLPSFYEKLKKGNTNKERNNNNYFVSGLPGSFYGRLLPSRSLNFVYSSYSLQWLSQVPEGLESNRNHIHMAMTSPKEVFEAYERQYQRDFYTFFSSRAEEMKPGGRMVLTFVGRSFTDHSIKDDCQHFALLSFTLLDMMDEGLVKETDLHSFNMPIYTPSKEEVEAVIYREGSFNLDRIEDFMVPWDAHDIHRLSNFIRAFTEPVIAAHFGCSIVDELYKRYEIKLEEHQLSKEEPSFFYNIVISLSKRPDRD